MHFAICIKQSKKIGSKLIFLGTKFFNFVFSATFIFALSLTTSTLILSACSNLSSLANLDFFEPKDTMKTAMETAERYQQMAVTANYPHSLEYRVLAAENYIQANQNHEATLMLRDLLNREPIEDPELKHIIYEARLSLVKEDKRRAIALL